MGRRLFPRAGEDGTVAAMRPPPPPPAATPAPPGLITYAELLARPHGAADLVHRYGPHPEQVAELWRPRPPAPLETLAPPVVLLHGGCWLAALPSLELMRPMAEALAAQGYAVWNLAYRRLGEAGGGYPGTFADVAAGVEALAAQAETFGLDLSRLVLAGHSAGGQLAVWAAQRPSLPPQSPLHAAHPLRPRGVVSLAGINDLQAYAAHGPDACGGPGTIDALVAAETRTDPFADTSPARLAPPAGLRVLSGALDPIVPPRFGEAFAAHMGVKPETLPGAGHFELIDPQSAAWPAVAAAIAAAAGLEGQVEA